MIFQLDHGCREARWSGPMHWQHSTEITEIVNVIVGQENVVLIGQHSQMNWNGNGQFEKYPLKYKSRHFEPLNWFCLCAPRMANRQRSCCLPECPQCWTPLPAP